MQATFNLAAITKYSDGNSGVRLEFEPPVTPVKADADFWAGTPTGRCEVYVNPTQAIGFQPGQTFVIQFVQIG